MHAHEMSTENVTCGNCRHEFAATALFCPHCGRAKVRDLDGDVLLGKVLGERFLVLERVGHGASGTIYRAEHVTLRRKVAIKVLHHEMSRDELAIERFRREATTVADIDNEHIVEIHDFGRTPDGRLYLAMEMLEGETLDVVLERQGTLPVATVIDVMIQVGEALMEAHAIGYVHRDLRPRNLFLAARRGKPNFVKLLDFGLAKLVEKEGGSAASTSLGMTFGDPRYMSPEQARGDAIDRRADIYQLGCIAFEMLTGAPPFVGGRVFDVLARHVSETPAPVGRSRGDVPAWLEATVARMLAKPAADRFVTVSRMVEALRLGEQTGALMPDAEARLEEAEPPPSVSRVMQKLGRTQLGPHDDGGANRPGLVAACGVAAADEAKSQLLYRVGPRGTPVVGVPIDAAAVARAAAPVVAAAAAPVLAPVVAPAPQAPPVVEPAARAVATPADAPAAGGVWERREAPARAPTAEPTAPRVREGSGSTGKLPAGARARRPSESAGISNVWFKDGEKLDGGDELDDSQAIRLERARVLQSSGDSMADYATPARRPVGKYVAIGVGGFGLLLLAVVLLAGGSGDKARPAAGGAPVASAVTPDAAPAEAVVDAGVAAGTAAASGTGAASGTAAEPRRDGGGAGTGGTGKKAGTGTGTATGRTDPLDPFEDPGPAPGTGKPTDEDKLQADFFAKTGEAQLRGGDAQSAAGSFKKASELDPRNITAITGLGEVAMQQGLYDAAIKHLKRAAKIAPGSSRVHTLLGECYLNTGRDEAAVTSFKKALQLDPDNGRARDGFNEASNRLPPPSDDP